MPPGAARRRGDCGDPLHLIGLAQERGATTVADLVELAATQPRRVQRKRSLAFGAPEHPGVYLFRDRHDQVLYVGRARDLRARLRSYFRSDRQRPAVEAALCALERVEWRVLGSELEAALEELRLIRELRPPANARTVRPDRVPLSPPPRRQRHLHLAAHRLGPLTAAAGAARLESPARCRVGDTRRCLTEASRQARGACARPALRGRRPPARSHRRTRGRGPRARGCISSARCPCASSPPESGRARRAFFVAKGQVVCARPYIGPQGIEWQAGLAAVAQAQPTLGPRRPTSCVRRRFIRRPPPELEVLRLAPFAHGAAA